MAAWVISKLSAEHDRSAFSCGIAPLDDWLKVRAGQFDRRDLARTYVATRESELIVLGYYAISNDRVAYDSLPQPLSKGLPKIHVPVALIGKLAVTKTQQGTGLGASLLLDALFRTAAISEHIGIRAVVVDAIDERARKFYLKFGFLPLLDDPNHLFLAMNVIRNLRRS